LKPIFQKIDEKLKKLFNKKPIIDLNENIAAQNIEATDNATKKYFIIPYVR